MTLTDTFTRNGWRELEEVEWQLDPFRHAIDSARRNAWSECDRLGDEMESYLAAVRRVQGRACREVQFLGSPAAQLPGSRQNTWREPRDPLA
jgi:hypothetical protein